MPTAPLLTLNDGHKIPALGFGTYPMKDQEVETAVQAALLTGYRLIDTAARYENETGVGNAIQASEIDRKDIFLTTKLRGSEQGYDEALRGLDASLQRLNMEYVDLYIIHWPLPAKDLYVESWKALIAAQKDGKVRSIGVSNFQPAHLERIIQETGVTPAVNQIEIHVDFPQPDLVAFNTRHNIQTEGWRPLGKDLLENPVIGQISEKHNRNPAQIMLRWATQSDIIPIPKSSNPDRMRANLEIFDFTLDDTDLAEIATLNTNNRLGGNPDTYEEF
ncbi:aldo/keto reductase [Acetobacter tropicalis]|uniref:Oxidoreductase of aldo/keto reductase family, subgroup 1 n=1 Tax=Acetobacter tropicalis TaxID=104102 RepID=A0A094YW28_9PROT|nr:aldo/keto reductase [Acetobacter tropicalis]KAA8389160.1 aldo/keto reductase [Acetobacter tropicalis]KAA8392351.1 aldo/keto reductase [Acetobacter tropicalis]KGB26200.1 oxidoreductase of aldo/keto reductase family, subgroup 1 [Acetobacter tropicalis]MBC9008389.1 aldo/keto reductase [Acetobacter tropicalis]MDO8170420.1 aldo/keto reductase [Acetobacter tropicalis]